VLSGSRTGNDIDAAPLSAVIEAGSRGGATVICDLPRRSTGAVEAVLDAADLVVIVAPADVRSCAAAAAISPWVSLGNPNAGVVVRGPSPGGLRPTEVAEIVGLPLLAAMRAEPRVADALERGGLRLRRRSALAVAARRVLAVLHRRQAVAA
jgi:secretion/DNA translocation related CpaE-like protein